jgi:hypothetical protein
MPWSTDYRADGAFVRFTGHTTGEDIICAKAEVYGRAQGTGLRFLMLDYEGVEDFDVDRDDVERTSAQDRAAASDGLRHLAFVAVAPDAITYGMSRMWEAQVEPTGWRTAVVISRADALTWLAEQGITTGV